MPAVVVDLAERRAFARERPDAEVRLSLYADGDEWLYQIEGGHDLDVMTWDDALRRAVLAIEAHREKLRDETEPPCP